MWSSQPIVLLAAALPRAHPTLRCMYKHTRPHPYPQTLSRYVPRKGQGKKQRKEHEVE